MRRATCLGAAVVMSVLCFALGDVQAQDRLEAAFIFGSRDLACETPNEPGTPYTVVFHGGNDCDSHNALAYGYDDPADDPDLGPRGYGFVPLTPGSTGRNCSRQFSQADEAYGTRFDESPNNRGNVGDDCPEQIYDSFIGAKNHSQPCNEDIVGNAVDPCTPGTTVTWRDLSEPPDGVNDPEPYVPAGIVFRVDVPNGLYRFVGVFGDVDNPHAHHIIAEDGGADSPTADETGWLLGPHVELVHNFSQRRAGGDLHMAVTGFGDKLPPTNFDPANPDPILHYFNSEGLETICTTPNSPVLEVTQGHIRIHVLQGSTVSGTVEDDGGDIVLLEIWEVDSAAIEPDLAGVTVTRTITEETFLPGSEVNVTLDVSGVPGSTVISETIPAGWTVTNAGGGVAAGGTLDFTVTADGQLQYTLEAGNDCASTAAFSGTADPGGLGCITTIGGESSLDLSPGLEVAFSRTLSADRYDVSDQVTVDLVSVSEIWAETTVTEVIPPEFTVVDDGGGTVVGDTLSFTFPADPLVDPELSVTRGGTSAEDPPAVASGPLVDGALVYVDRDHVYADVAGSLVAGAPYIQVANDDKNTADYSLDVQAAVDGTLFLMIDDRVGDDDNTTPPDVTVNMQWVLDNGFTDTDTNIAIDEGNNGSVDQQFSIFSKALPANTTETLGVSLHGGNNYGVAFLPDDMPEPATATYIIEAEVCTRVSVVGESLPVGGCPSAVAGDSNIRCSVFICDPEPEGSPPELVGAFAFGSRDLSCETRSEPGTLYTMVHHVNDAAGYLAIEYDNEKGYGFEVIDPGNEGRNGAARFGPFDDSPNDRNAFSDECGEELYDSFIGFKDYTNTCDAATIGDGDTPCDTVLTPEGGIFRVDVPNGDYRFVAVVGEATNTHAHRMLAEDGGVGGPPDISAAHVTLVNNFDQAQYDFGEVSTGEPGQGVFGRVGFNCRIPPLGDNTGADPAFVNFGPDGLPSGPGDDGLFGTPDDPPPESPTLTVTQGYIRFHLLQGNSNDGPGGPRDPNGTDVVIIEVWKLGEGPVGGTQKPGDFNQDGGLDISDPVALLTHLFLGGPPPPCGSQAVGDPANVTLLDANDDGGIDISDAVGTLTFLFLGGPPLTSCTGGVPPCPCIVIPDCPDNPIKDCAP